jgi:8-oxo-dGTP pyrophosphatase MutT (NUDIX family)
VTQAVSRVGARVLLVDPEQCVLLIHERITSGTHWLTPGGGQEPGESLQEAAVREVFEETSIRVDLEPDAEVVHIQQRFWHWDAMTYDQTDHFFFVRLQSRPPVEPAAPTEMERETLLGHRWWSVAELRAATDRIEPPDLGDVLEQLLASPSRSGT